MASPQRWILTVAILHTWWLPTTRAASSPTIWRLLSQCSSSQYRKTAVRRDHMTIFPYSDLTLSPVRDSSCNPSVFFQLCLLGITLIKLWVTPHCQLQSQPTRTDTSNSSIINQVSSGLAWFGPLMRFNKQPDHLTSCRLSCRLVLRTYALRYVVYFTQPTYMRTKRMRVTLHVLYSCISLCSSWWRNQTIHSLYRTSNPIKNECNNYNVTTSCMRHPTYSLAPIERTNPPRHVFYRHDNITFHIADIQGKEIG